LEGGDVVQMSDVALLGTGFRSAPEAATRLGRFLGKPVLLLELVDPHFYHLDTALAALSDGTVLACREAFSAKSWQRLKGLRNDFVEVPRAEAMRFALNWVEVGKRVVCGTRSEPVFELLRKRGRTPVHVDLSEFVKAGGSAACLTARAA